MSDHILFEEQPLGEGRAYGSDDLDSSLADRPGIGSVLRAAALKAAGVRDEHAPTGARVLLAARASTPSTQPAPPCAPRAAQPQHNLVYKRSVNNRPVSLADLELALSRSGRAAAVVELRRRRAALLTADDHFSSPRAFFEPPRAGGGGAGGGSAPDVITGVCWGSVGSGGGGGEGAGSSGGEAAGEDVVLVSCQSSCLYLLDR